MLMVDGAVEKNVVITYSTNPEKKNKKNMLEFNVVDL